MKDENAAEVEGKGMPRRTALKLTAIGVVGLGLGVGSSVLVTRLVRTYPAAYRFFTQAEAGRIVALCEQIIPRDDVAGATDAGVVYYIDRQLVGAFARHGHLYRRALAALSATCLNVHQKSFEGMSGPEQVAVMRLMETGKVPPEPWSGVSSREFFRLLVEHTMQGYYGSPRHGGNRGYISYRVLGLDYPQIIGQNRYREV